MTTPIVDEETFWGTMLRLRTILEWTQKQPDKPEVAWATRQAFVTVLAWMEHWAITDGVKPLQIAQFDDAAKQSATTAIPYIEWRDRKKIGAAPARPTEMPHTDPPTVLARFMERMGELDAFGHFLRIAELLRFNDTTIQIWEERSWALQAEFERD